MPYEKEPRGLQQLSKKEKGILGLLDVVLAK